MRGQNKTRQLDRSDNVLYGGKVNMDPYNLHSLIERVDDALAEEDPFKAIKFIADAFGMDVDAVAEAVQDG